MARLDEAARKAKKIRAALQANESIVSMPVKE